ncbi:MAG: hypothetical protein ACM3JP_01825, partial [Betaproteobacteria bacterium]
AAVGLAAPVAACAGPTTGSAPAPSTSTLDPAPVPSGTTPVPAPPGTPATATTAAQPPPDNDSFVLTAGAEHRACGISVRVRFLPPSGSDNQDQAFLVGTPSGQPEPDQPAPAAVAPARAGAVAIVLGQRFMVVAIDRANARVSLKALC